MSPQLFHFLHNILSSPKLYNYKEEIIAIRIKETLQGLIEASRVSTKVLQLLHNGLLGKALRKEHEEIESS